MHEHNKKIKQLNKAAMAGDAAVDDLINEELGRKKEIFSYYYYYIFQVFLI